jgi:hypothetical protein
VPNYPEDLNHSWTPQLQHRVPSGAELLQIREGMKKIPPAVFIPPP